MSLVLAALAGIMLLAQSPQPALYIDLSGEWRLTTGDDPRYASPDFDDGNWKTVTVPYRGEQIEGTWWMRRSVTLPNWAVGTPLAVTIGGLNEVYELFVNGERIATVGERKLSRMYVARPRTFLVPSEALRPGSRRVVIALRLWSSSFRSSNYRSLRFNPDEGPWLLTSQANALLHLEDMAMRRRERSATSRLIMGELEAVLALVLLLGWLLQRERTDLAFLAGVMISESVLAFYNWVSLVADWPHLSNGFAAIGLTSSVLFLVYFVDRTLGHALPWLRRAAWIPLLWHVGGNIPVLWTDGDAQVPSFNTVWYLANAVLLATAFVAGRAACRGWNADRRHSLVLALAAMLSFFQTQRGGNPWHFIENRVVWRDLGFSLHDGLIAIFALTLTLLLVRDLGIARLRLQTEMQAARLVQQLMLNAAPGKSKMYETHAAYEAMQEVGGDFYQVLPLDDGGLLVVIGDVSGKGLKAAMVVSMVVGVIRSRVGLPPADLLAAVNRTLVGSLEGGFVSCVAARFSGEGMVQIANAGHLAPYRSGVEIETESGLPLGVLAGAAYSDVELVLGPGESLAFVTDGVVEAANAGGELYGFERTREVSSKPAHEIVRTAQAWGQNDDITVVTVRRLA